LVFASAAFDRNSLELAELSSLFQRQRFEEVRRRGTRMWPTWLLSPRYHALLGSAAVALKDLDDAELEHFQAQTCLEGLLRTGDGTLESPYLVVRLSDEYDILQALGRQACGQQLVQREGESFDVITCDDASQIWFDAGHQVPAFDAEHICLGAERR
jgi:hypothetical protein